LQNSHAVNYAIINIRHSPGGGTTFAKHDVSNYIFPGIVWYKFHENPFSHSRERLSHSFGGQKKQKNNGKTYTHPPPTGRRLRK